jgi:hypothetical protein
MSLSCTASPHQVWTRHRDRPEKELVFKVARQEGVVDIRMVTELDSDGDGKIGAQLATYAKLSRRAASGPIDAAGKAGREFVRMVSLVGQGERPLERFF